MSILKRPYTKETSMRVDRVIDRFNKREIEKLEQSECRHVWGHIGMEPIWVEGLPSAVHDDDFYEYDTCPKCGRNLFDEALN